jgi:outer membrane protein assembly factor BamB
MSKSWVCCLSLLATAATAAEQSEFRPHKYDWPQWQGPDRTGISHETGLLKSWPKDGPPLAWKAKDLGGGYSTPSVAAGRVIGMSLRGKSEVVWALAEADGKELWSTPIAPKNPAVAANVGPRCTPAVDGDRVYALGVSGDLVCLDAATGKKRWHKNLARDFHGHMMSHWGYSESPLVDGDKLICTPGGRDATLIALNKKTGATLWKAQVPQGDGASYASAIAADLDGQRQYIQFLGRGMVGVAAKDGKFLWRYDHAANFVANCTTPVYHDGEAFGTSAYNKGAGLVKLVREGNRVEPKEVYFSGKLRNHHGGVVLVDGYLYGAHGGNRENRFYALVCLEFDTGKVMWQSHDAGKGSPAYADGCLYYRNEGGPMLLVEATPKGYVERGRFEPPDRSKLPAWSHPAIANGKLYLRDQGVLLCYDVKER